MSGKGGVLPVGHPRACGAPKHDGTTCRKYALKGASRCEFHGGRMQQRAGRADLYMMPRFYAKRLMPTLLEAVNASLEAPTEEVINIYEELAVYRAHAGQAVEMWSKASEKGLETALLAGAVMREVLQEVCALVDKAARIDQHQGVITVHQLHGFVQQLVRIAYEELAESDARKLEAALHNRVRVPTGQPGTDITPDQDVLEMDSTIASS